MPIQTTNRPPYCKSAMAKALLRQTEPSRKKGGLGIEKIKETLKCSSEVSNSFINFSFFDVPESYIVYILGQSRSSWIGSGHVF